MIILQSETLKNISHEKRSSSFEESKEAIKRKIKKRGDLPDISAEKQLQLLEELSSFELGKFLIETGGLNGFWTHYVVTHPQKGRLTNLDIEGSPFCPLESFLLNSSPSSLATQERFNIFKEQIQSHLQDRHCLASIPCGIMSDLLDLNYSNLKNFNLYGIDLDPETISLAKSYAKEKSLLSNCNFLLQDAWSLDMSEKFDLISSNGLAIYEPDDEKVIGLYQKFYKALKPQGLLITSFLTPPPGGKLKTEWRLDKINLQDAKLQKILFLDILDVKWQIYRSEKEVKDQLENAGFGKIEIIYDTAHIFPVVTAKKLQMKLTRKKD